MSLSQAGETLSFDALVIGGGIAGLMFCLELSALNPNCSIALLVKEELEDCNSRYAQGGIAASHHSDIQSHLNDTLNAGRALCHKANAKNIINESDEAIAKLVHHGVAFDKHGDKFLLAKEGGHSTRRIYHAGDHTGQTIIDALKRRLYYCNNVTVFTQHIAVNLIKSPDVLKPKAYGEVIGAYVLDNHTLKIHTFIAKATILATGGSGKTYRFTTNPGVATGDGVAMAARAGARLANMEFYQFHPTLLYHQNVHNFLISEALRGEGAKLLNADTHTRFMEHYEPQLMELAPRDIVAQAIFTEIEKSQADFVYLDITHQSRLFLLKHFPNIYHTLRDLGIDMNQDLIPVVPAAHYQCGGIITNTLGETDLKRLYAIGEVAYTGLHGANRLASNSLMEAAVTAKNCAKTANKYLGSSLKAINIAAWNSGNEINLRRQSQINAHWRGLRGEMTSYAGIVRTEAGLKDLLNLILLRKKIVEEYYWQHQITRDLVELRNIIFVSEVIVRSALNRRESRGGHFREDYPTSLKTAECSIHDASTPVV